MTRDEHLLTCLAEECTEVGQRVSKALRFGLGEVQEGQPLSNADRIMVELHDLVSVALLIHREGKLGAGFGIMPSEETILAKRQKIEKYFAISRAQGTLTDPSP